MKVTFQTCCGIDVHKSFLVATIIKTTDGMEPSYQKKRFSTFNNSILTFKQWLLDNNCRVVCMESASKYWIPVFNLLEDEITRYRYKLVSCRSSEKNRYQFPISLGSHPHPLLITCLNSRVRPLTTKKSHPSFSGALNPKKTL